MLSLINCLTRLGDHQHLHRERALAELNGKDLGDEELQASLKIIELMFKSRRWEDRFGAITGATSVQKRFSSQADV